MSRQGYTQDIERNGNVTERDGKIMAVYHVVYEKFWTDADVSECSAHEKYFLLSSLVFPQVKMCGCYEITIKQISDYMGLEMSEIESIIDGFERRGKFLMYDRNTKELFMKNWFKYNWTDSPSVDKRLREEISEIKNDQFRNILTERYNKRKTVSGNKSIRLNEKVKNKDTVGLEEDEPQIALVESGDDSFDAPVVEASERDPVPYKQIVDMWNEICVSFGRVRGYSGKRRGAISARWNEFKDLDVFRQVFENTENSPFMKGQNNRNWQANFDWVMCPTNFQKVLENKYDPSRMTWNQQNDDDGWAFIKSVAAGNGGNV